MKIMPRIEKRPSPLFLFFVFSIFPTWPSQNQKGDEYLKQT